MIKIFDAQEKDFSSNGNVVIDPLKCKEYKKKSLNGWYIECEINIKYNEYIEKDKLCVLKTRSKANPQAFRIGDKIQRTKTKISFTAEHVMFDSRDYFLVDVRPTKLNGSGALEYINLRTDKESPFFVYSDVENVTTEYFIRKTLFQAWSLIEQRWGGVFDADNWDVRLLNHVGTDKGESVIYGKNMENMIIFEDWSEVCTKVYPVGYDELLLPEEYIESEVQYEKPYTKTITFESDLDVAEAKQEELITELRKKAIEYLDQNKYPKVSYEVSSKINQNMEIGDTIQVKHPLVNIETEVLEYVNDVVLEKIISLTFGNYSRDVKVKFDSIKSSISEVKNIISKQEIAIKEQTTLINTLNKEGYVYIDDNEILIVDELPKENAKNVWRFGLGGIGFSSKGYKGPFKTAITMDGKINADFITTGKLSVNIIEGLAETLESWSKIILDMKNIQLLVHDTVDIRRKVEGEKLVLENCMEGELQELRILGNNKVFDYLYPSNDLYPSDDLYPYGDSRIKVYQDVKDKFEKKFGNRDLTVTINYDSNYNITGYRGYSRKSTSSRRYYILPLEPGKTYDIFLDKDEISNTKWIYLETFETDPFENDTDDNINAINYYGLYECSRDFENNSWLWNIDSEKNHIKITPTEKEKYLIMYNYSASTFETAQIYTNYQHLDLGITEVLRQKEEVFDEYILSKNIAKIIRRIGVQENGETYILPNEEIEILDDFSIHLPKGTNTIEIENYTANMEATFLIINEFTSKFVSEVDLDSKIIQLANQINLIVRKKVGIDEIFARINMAVLGIDDAEIPDDIEKSIIEILANKISIKSDYFELTKNGVIKAFAGIIGGLILNQNELYKRYIYNNLEYESGLSIPNEITMGDFQAFLYAGKPVGKAFYKGNMYITHTGKTFIKNGNLSMMYEPKDDESGVELRTALRFDKYVLERFLENGNHWSSEGVGFSNGSPNSHTVWLYDALAFTVQAGEQHNYENLFSVYRRGNNNEAPVSYFWTNLYVNGTQVGPAASDKRLKKYIKDCKKSALKKINQFIIKSFKWKKGKNPFDDAEDSVDFGIIAQDAIEVDPNSVIHNKKNDTWQINKLDLICTCIKALQELYKKVLDLKKENKKLKKQVDANQKSISFLINKLECKEEFENFLKGDKI